jgi:hypothetical protein
MINGNPVILLDDFRQILSDGDEISVVCPWPGITFTIFFGVVDG